MSTAFGGVERPGPWETVGDHERRIRALEASLACCVPSPEPLDEIILANPCLVSFWKLNETTGDIAFDSKDGFDMDSGAGNPPTWADATTPFGEVSPLFGSGILEENTSFPALSADLTLEIWGNRIADIGGIAMISQGNPHPANQPGVSLDWIGEGTPTVYYARATIGDSSGGPHTIQQDLFVPDGDWHYFVLTRESNVWTLYVDAVVIGTYDDSGTDYSTSTGIQVGNIAGSLTTGKFPGNLSYAAAYDCALTAAEVTQHYTAGIGGEGGGLVDGWVLTADSTAAEGWSWQPPTIEVLEDGV